MDEITDQNQPVSYFPVADVLVMHPGRAASGQAARAKAGLVTHQGSGPASSRDPGRPGVPGIFHRRGRGPARRSSPGVVRDRGRGRADDRHGDAGG